MRLVTPTRLLACPDFNMINCQRLLVLVLRASDYSTQLLAISMLLATSMPLASARVSGGPGLKFFPEPPEELCRAQPTAGGGPGAPPRGSLRRSAEWRRNRRSAAAECRGSSESVFLAEGPGGEERFRFFRADVKNEPAAAALPVSSDTGIRAIRQA